MQFSPDLLDAGYMIVAGKGIHETQFIVPCGCINELINFWEQVIALRIYFVEVREVHTHLPNAI